MQTGERLQGEQTRRIIQGLRKNRTMVRVRLLGGDYERLTIVTGIGRRGGAPYFRIDCPEGFKEALARLQDVKMLFDFTSSEGIQYSFKSWKGESLGAEFWIRFPDCIKRIQRRKEFRLEAPLGTVMQVRVNAVKHETSVVNVSLGGALVALEKEVKNDFSLEAGKLLHELLLRFPSKDAAPQVRIRQAVVKRISKDAGSKRYRCALRFTDLEEQEKSVLNGILYKFQREFLRKIKYMEGQTE